MVEPSADNRPPMVVAMQWVSQITAIGLEMSLPAGCGYWLDVRWGTLPLMVVLGAGFGFTIGMLHLLRMVRVSESGRGHSVGDSDTDPDDLQ